MIWIDDDGAMLVGHQAKQKFLTHPKNTIYGAKRLMGRRFSGDEIEDIRKRFFYEIAQNDAGEPMVKAGNRYLDLVEVGATILEYCKRAARDYLQQPVDAAVISVPAYFNQRQREAVKLAGERAGLDVLRIVNEPTAAAVAYGVTHRERQRILVYDLGGGTFDVTVLEIRDQCYEVLATGGDSFLGGIDFDNQLVNYFVSLIKSRHKVDVGVDYTALQRLRSAAESAKIDLSSATAVPIVVPFLLPNDGTGKPLDFESRLTRENFEEMSRPLVLKTLKLMNNVLLDAKLKREDINELVFVGGMTRMPLVEQIITKHFGKKPRKDVHPDEVVAQGAAILAHSIVNDEDAVELLDVLPVSIGVAVDDGPYTTLVAHNTRVPHDSSHTFRTSKDGQTGVTIRVFQGEGDMAAENEYLGGLNVAGFEPAPAGSVEFAVNVSLDRDSILLLAATGQNGRPYFSQFLTERMVEKESFKPTLEAEPKGDAKKALQAAARAALENNPAPEQHYASARALFRHKPDDREEVPRPTIPPVRADWEIDEPATSDDTNGIESLLAEAEAKYKTKEDDEDEF